MKPIHRRAVGDLVTSWGVVFSTMSNTSSPALPTRLSSLFSRERRTLLAEWWWTIDRELLAAFLLLLFFGIILSFAASPAVAEAHNWSTWHFVTRHIIFASLAAVVMMAVSMLPHRYVRSLAWVALAISLILLIATLQFGEEVKGARRWISVLFITVQPSEIVKPAFAVVAAWLFSEKMRQPDMPGRLVASVLMLLAVTPLLLQPDIGQTALLVLTWSALMFFSGISWWFISVLMGMAVAGAFAAYTVFPHVSNRINAFFNQGDGTSYQVQKAIGSILEGSWFGRGPGEAITKRYLPDAHADYVFSAAIGEFGILFGMVLVGLICFIVLRALSGALAQKNLFARLAAGTLALQFGMQSAINLAVNVNLMPPKGMTLPFVSYGGTSMIAIAFGMGMMLALMRKRPEERLATGLPAAREAVARPSQ